MHKNQDSIFRFAPSPTGYLHVGGARTAIFNWLLAYREGGKFLLRIEDTDRKRSSTASIQQIINSLQWLGLKWDSEPLFQSQRFRRYQEVVQQIIKKGMAYYCFCSKEILQQQKAIAQEQKQPYLYDGRCKKLTQQQVKTNLQKNISHTVRLKVPEGYTRFLDGVHGEVVVNNNEIDDFVILRSDNTPVYQLAVVVDDHDMGITHILRGDDHLSNTPKQILIFQALDWPIPKFSHLPLILGPDKVPLSKRHGASSVEDFREQGILPEALFNYLCLLGWAPGNDKELMSREEIIERFTLERVNKANAVFDLQKLLWINGKYLTKLNMDDLISILKQRMENDQLREIGQHSISFNHLVDLVKQRARTVQDIESGIQYFFYDPSDYDQKGVEKYFKNPECSDLLSGVLAVISSENDFAAGPLELKIRSYAEERGINAAQIIHPLRLALTGRTASPGIFEIMQILGRMKVNRRIQRALEFIKMN
jgi:glutamyl-tRNA synthetase